jgi:uncharacterized membrane protein YvbJ
MAVCPYCGKENNQPDAAYCLYCGSSLRQQPQSISTMNRAPMTIGQTYGMTGGTLSSSGMSSSEISERYQKAVAKVERLGNIVIVLAIVTLILVFL